jgi:ArsR family transcriptional regulator
MDSATLLDLLGNENRRRILRLLAHRSCYVTEISDALGVSPKAVIEHLKKLEAAGLVVSHTEDSQRKYFRIDRNVRLEVTLSPYDFGAKSAYPASHALDEALDDRLSITPPGTDTEDAATLGAAFGELHDLDRDLSLAKRWTHGRLTEVIEDITAEVDIDGRLVVAVLRALADGHQQTASVAEAIGVPPEVVEEALVELAAAGVVEQTDGWRLPNE